MKARSSIACTALFLAISALAPVGKLSARVPEQDITTQWVENFGGDSSAYSVQRPGKGALPVRSLMSLKPNDIVNVSNDTGWIELHLETHGEFFICRSEKAGRPCDGTPPFKVPSTKAPLTVSDRVVDWLRGHIYDWIDNHETTTAQDAMTNRGGSISAPLLAARPTRLVEGKRKLCLAWSGGNQPYRIRIVNSANQARVLDADLKSGPTWCSQEIDLKQGVYLLSLTSADSAFDSGFFVVGEKEAPVIPDLGTGLDLELRTTIEAAWLSSQGNGVWLWEAYSRVVPLCDTYRPAQALCRSLENGNRPASAPDLSAGGPH